MEVNLGDLLFLSLGDLLFNLADGDLLLILGKSKTD